MNILTIDIGTSSCKAVIFSEDGEELASARGSYSLLFPKAGYVEQDPEEILGSIENAVKALWIEGADPCEIGAVSFSAQIAAQCLVDEKGKALTNLISWMDGRARKESDAFQILYSQEEIHKMTGVDMVITPSYGIAKLKWMHSNIPETLKQAYKFVQIKDYLIFRLTGQWVSDVTSMKGLVHAGTLLPVPEVLAFVGCDESIYPKTEQPYSVAGLLHTALPGFHELPDGIPVITGWNDMNAAFLGMGAMGDGCIGLDMTGTSEHLGCVRMLEAVPAARYEGINHVPYLEGKECFYGVTSSGGQAVEWYIRDFLGMNDMKRFFEQAFEKAGRPYVPAMDLPLCLPYLEGERNPWNNPTASGMFFGLRRYHGKDDLAISVLEGVCFALKAIYDRLPEKPKTMVVSGGAGFNNDWNQMKADVMQTEFVRLEHAQAGCVGAAMLAMKALHPERPWQDLTKMFCRQQQIFLPDPARHEIYEHRYRKFLQLYHVAEPLFGG